MIIGPAIRRMKEKEAKKKMPTASEEETLNESSGLRVGAGAWKWPPVWPYADELWLRPDEIPEATPSVNPMELINGKGPGLAVDLVEKPKMDTMAFWAENGADDTYITGESTEKLAAHIGYYLKDGMDVLELGAAEKSYLPDGLKFGRHVGVGANAVAMGRNSALTESMVVDLNDVTEEVEVNSEELRALGYEKFDAIIMANTMDFLTGPREVFKTCWRLLKPGGVMIVAFARKDAFSSKFGKAQTKMWTNYNDDQHLWVAGSFFQFSAGAEGWEDLKGFDISPEGSKSDVPLIGGLIDKVTSSADSVPIYAVQATKVQLSEDVNQDDPARSFKEQMALQPTLDERDKVLLAPRLGRAWKLAETEEQRSRILENVETLPAIYESLIKMDQFAFPFQLQAQLATNLCTDIDFVGNEVQIENLKMGLGLSKPSEEFWKPIGSATADMDPEDKVNLLSHIVPRFGGTNPAMDGAATNFLSGLRPAVAVIKGKCSNISNSDAQLVATELLAAEILKPGLSTKAEFAAWLGELTEGEIQEMIKTRKAYRNDAAEAMAEMQKIRKQMREETEARLKAEREELIRAAEERTMAFDERTGTFREIVK